MSADDGRRAATQSDVVLPPWAQVTERRRAHIARVTTLLDQWARALALTPDERELWIADGVQNRVHIFDAREYPPVSRASIDLSAQPRWIAFSADGQYAYASTGDIIGAATKRIVGALEDQAGVKVTSENFQEIELAKDK